MIDVFVSFVFFIFFFLILKVFDVDVKMEFDIIFISF